MTTSSDGVLGNLIIVLSIGLLARIWFIADWAIGLLLTLLCVQVWAALWALQRRRRTDLRTWVDFSKDLDTRETDRRLH